MEPRCAAVAARAPVPRPCRNGTARGPLPRHHRMALSRHPGSRMRPRAAPDPAITPARDHPAPARGGGYATVTRPLRCGSPSAPVAAADPEPVSPLDESAVVMVGAVTCMIAAWTREPPADARGSDPRKSCGRRAAASSSSSPSADADNRAATSLPMLIVQSPLKDRTPRVEQLPQQLISELIRRCAPAPPRAEELGAGFRPCQTAEHRTGLPGRYGQWSHGGGS